MIQDWSLAVVCCKEDESIINILPANDAGWHREGNGPLGAIAVALLAAGAVLTLGASVGTHHSPLFIENGERRGLLSVHQS